MDDGIESAVAKATHVAEQTEALLLEMESRTPNALHHMAHKLWELGRQKFSAAEWEMIRHMAILGWSHHSLTVLTTEVEDDA